MQFKTEVKDDDLEGGGSGEEQKYESRFAFLDKQITNTNCFHGEQFHLY